MEETLLQYGALGAILLYFVWKDNKTFELHKKNMEDIVNQMKLMQQEQSGIKKDLESIKSKIQ